MERILVGIHSPDTSFWAGVHALNLAKRIGARVSFLLVVDRVLGSTGHSEKEIETSLRKKIESLIEEGRSEGIAVDYYLTYGNFESELIRFSQENKVTLLVVESPRGKATEHFSSLLEKIRHRINCRIEVVHEKPALSSSHGEKEKKKRR
ncbi:MAG: hypothetical protein B1H13_02760 [Desulfobacteraceae bacterium 4484_190.3]|nr:MAG: hypothetical protein B1H13_02760 [Desulfobacteraceae bacterium 4484_190.3]